MGDGSGSGVGVGVGFVGGDAGVGVGVGDVGSGGSNPNPDPHLSKTVLHHLPRLNNSFVTPHSILLRYTCTYYTSSYILYQFTQNPRSCLLVACLSQPPHTFAARYAGEAKGAGR